MLYSLDMHFENGLFAGQFGNEIAFREGYVHIGVVVFLQTDQLVFKAGDEGAGADFQRIALTFAAAEGFAVHRAGKVDNGEVAFFDDGLVIGIYHLRAAVAQVFQRFVNVFVGNAGFFFLHMDAFVFTQFRFRFQHNLDFRFKVLAFFKAFKRFLLIQHFRIGNRHQLFRFNCFLVSPVHADIECFFLYGTLAVMHFDNITRRFARTETGDPYLVRNPCHSLFKAFVNFSSRNRNF